MNSILFLLPSLAGGGGERSVLTLAEGFVKRNWKVAIICATATGPLRGQIPKNVELIDLGAGRVLSALPRLARVLRERPDSVVFSSMSHMSAVALIAGRILSRHQGPMIVQEVARLVDGRDHQSRVKWFVLRHVMRRLFSRADCIVAVSDSIRLELEAAIPAVSPLVRVIPSPVNLALAAARGTELVTHAWLTGPRERPVIFGAGRLSPEKGFDLLIAALRRLHDAGGRQRLILAGMGAEANALKAQAARLGLAEDIDFLGHVDNPWSLMTAADLVVVPSRAEGFCLVLVEAMSLGSQVVAARFGSSALDILDNGCLGELAEAGDPAALAEAITRAFDAPRLPEALRAGADRFEAERIISDYADLAAFLQERSKVH
jgi:glycosyltransferase involved in cell wall biosynthesis